MRTPIIYVLPTIPLVESHIGFQSLHNRVNIKMGIIYKNVNNTLFPLEIYALMKYYISTGNYERLNRFIACGRRYKSVFSRKFSGREDMVYAGYHRRV